MAKKITIERFLRKVVKVEEVKGSRAVGGCWLWTASTNGGYGQFTAGGKNRRAHRWLWEVVNGPVPKGLELDHLCRTRNCVNPEHLEAVTHHENVLRGECGLATAALNRAKTECPRGHPYSVENTRYQGTGRACITCITRRSRERYLEL